MDFDLILIRYGELALKQGNRGMFEQQLKKNIELSLQEYEYDRVKKFQGGFKVYLLPASPVDEICSRLEKVAGIAWFAPAFSAERDPETLASLALDRGQNHLENASTFAVDTQRSDKEFDLNSMDFNRRVGAVVDEDTSLTVDLDDPDWEINIHVLWEEALLFFNRRGGLGGLPVGTAGDVLVLLSGGIDSPVAAIKAMRRGARPDFLHFYAYPSPEKALDRKIRPLVEKLVEFNRNGKLYLVPYLPFEFGSAEVSPSQKMVLFRRHTVRVACKVAGEDAQQALVTGESLGQVASQTLENMEAIAAVSDRLILRPLVGLDKQQIVDLARRRGTYDISIRDYKDCCAIQARHPDTKSFVPRLQALEEKYELEKLDERAISQMKILEFGPGGLEEIEAGVN